MHLCWVDNCLQIQPMGNYKLETLKMLFAEVEYLCPAAPTNSQPTLALPAFWISGRRMMVLTKH